MRSSDIKDTHREKETSAEKLALAWHGFGSPVGLAILIVSSGAAALMWRLAVFGWDNP